MAIKHTQGGFALLISVIFMSVMLTFGLALSSLGYKQATLASSALSSQYAFYAADTALECALYADQQLGIFAYQNPTQPETIDCSGITGVSVSQTISGALLTSKVQFSLDSGKHCADVTVYKYDPSTSPTIGTYIFSQGYDVSCATLASQKTNPTGARFSSRGISIHY